jgi:hypothetical protein
MTLIVVIVFFVVLALSGCNRQGRRLRPAPSNFVCLSLDLPRCVVGDVHRSITAGTCQCGHCIASERLTPGDSSVLAGAARDDMGAAFHFWLRLVEVARIEGRENLVTVGDIILPSWELAKKKPSSTRWLQFRLEPLAPVRQV